jgi:hypothetical protein
LAGSIAILQWRASKDGIQKAIKPAGDPGCINLEFYDHDSIGFQKALGLLKRFERIDVIVNPYVCEM